MMMMVVRFPCLTLEVLLNGRVVLLGSRNVPGLEILRKLVERLGDGIVALRRRSRIGLLAQRSRTHENGRDGQRLRQGYEIRLRRRQIPRVQVLTELLEFLL